LFARGEEISICTRAYNASRFAESQATLEQVIADGVREANLFDLLASCHHRQQRLPDAVRAMSEAIRLEPASGLRYAHLAQILLEEKRYPDAYDAAKKAAEFAGDGYFAYKVRGDVETTLGMLKQAEVSYSRAVQLNPQDPEAILLLGISQHSLWKYKEAKTSFERGLRLFPNNARFHLAYGKLLLDPGAKADAGTQATAVSLLERLDTSLSEAHYELGKHLLRMDRAEQALPHLEIAAKLNPGNSRIHLTLANAYRVTGWAEAAASELNLFKTMQGEGH